MQNIKNIIFDIGNVLAKFGWREYFSQYGYDEETMKKIEKATVKSTEWCEYDRGVMDDEEILEAFVKNDPTIETQLRSSLKNLHGMVSRLSYSVPWLESLKQKGYRVYFLSNFSKKAYLECADALDFLPAMDGGVFSYQDHLIKPDPDIYRLLLDRYGLCPQECVFLDDTAENLPPAERIGIHTIHFQSREQAVEDLKKLGVSTV